MGLSNLEVHWLVKELKRLEGSYFVKFSRVDGFYKLRVRDGGTKDIIINPPEFIFLTRHTYKAREPGPLSMKIRKELKGSKLVEIKQPNFDRIVEFVFSNGFRIVIELFSHGNIILVSPDGETIAAKEYQRWKDREIKPRKPYLYPASTGLDPRTMSLDEFKSIFEGPDVIRSLVKGVKLGNSYLEYACQACGEEKNSKRPRDAKALFEKIKQICDTYMPGILEGYGPVIFQIRDGNFERKSSFNEALDDLYSREVKGKGPTIEGKREKLMARLKKQEEKLALLSEEIKKNKEIGDLIYKNYNYIEKLIGQVHEMREKGLTWENIEKRLGIKIDQKKGVFWIELG